MRTIVLGTGNKHKVQEIAPLLRGLPVTVKAAGEYGPFDPDETGETLEANSLIKAQAALKLSGEWSISDDTGLFIEALDGRPGIYAARYAGVGCSFADNIRKVLKEMADVELGRRSAMFACVITLCRSNEEPLYFRGECKGYIAIDQRGTGGFGYDPIFVIDELQKSFAELTTEEKNRVSHRALAVNLCRAALEKLL